MATRGRKKRASREETEPRLEVELRKYVARRLGKRDVADRVWKMLKKDRYVSEALDPALTDRTRDRLVDRARELYDLGNAVRGKRPTQRTKTLPTDPLLPDPEYERARIFARYVAHLGSDEQEVREVRTKLLGGRLLSPGRALKFIRSPALRFLSLETFERLGVPVVGHKSKLVNFPYILVTPRGWQDDVYIELLHRRQKHEVPISWAQHNAILADDCPKLAILPANVEGAFLPGSALRPLKDAGVRLARYYGWSEAEATWFVLTGTPPRTAAVTAQVTATIRQAFSHYQLTLTVQPWVSPRTVTRVYQHAQRKMMDRQPRLLNLKNLQIFDFVVSQGWRPDQKGPFPWTKWMNAWNHAHREHPEEQFERMQDFRRDFLRALRHVPHPPLRWPTGPLFQKPR